MIVFQCPNCQRSLRATELHAGKMAQCPCGHQVIVTDGAGTGLWFSLFRSVQDRFGWKCPQCQGKVTTDATTCPHCHRELPVPVAIG
jgi:DNA-directed RNA polymerase subunit RPC12/RpoP